MKNLARSENLFIIEFNLQRFIFSTGKKCSALLRRGIIYIVMGRKHLHCFLFSFFLYMEVFLFSIFYTLTFISKEL